MPLFSRRSQAGGHRLKLCVSGGRGELAKPAAWGQWKRYQEMLSRSGNA